MTRRIFECVQGMGVAAAVVGTLIVGSVWLSNSALAASAKDIDAGVDEAIVKFEQEVKEGKSFLASSKGMLVFPSVLKGGLGVGAEYGEGALRIDGKSVGYYSTAAASFGLQAGGQVKTVFVVFLQADALKQFQESKGWKAGVDGSVALVTLGAGGAVDTTTLKDPIVGFVFGQKGLMYNLTFEGSKFTKLDKS